MFTGLSSALAASAALLAAVASAPAGADGAPLAVPHALDRAENPPTCSFQASGEELRGRLSPPDSSSVTLDGTVVKICYSSPRKRGREIFGGLVPLDQPWRLGANEPTTLHVTGPVRVGDLELEAGSYALYAVPGEESWQVFFNSAVDRWGIPITPEVREHDVGSVSVTPGATEETVEALKLTLSPAEGGGATFSMAWDDVRWSVSVHAAPAEEGEGTGEDGYGAGR